MKLYQNYMKVHDVFKNANAVHLKHIKGAQYLRATLHNFFVTLIVKPTASSLMKSGMRKKIHETLHTSTKTCTRSAQLQSSVEHHLRQSSLEIVSCKVY